MGGCGIAPLYSLWDRDILFHNHIKAVIIFYILDTLLFAVTLIGYVIWVGRALLAWRNSGVSTAAQASLSMRRFEHNLGTRQNELAYRLMMVLPGVFPLACAWWRITLE